MASDAAPEANLPPLVQPVARRFADAVSAAFGRRLVGLLAYGSAVAGGFRPGVSDLNLLVVLDAVEPADLELLGRLAAASRKVRLTPVALTAGELAATASTAPAVLWDLRDRSVVLAGEDPLGELDLQLAGLARQLRFELRDKLYRLRAEYLATGGNGRAQERLAGASFGSVLHLLRNLLRLAGRAADLEPLSAIGEAARALGLELRTLQSLYLIRSGEKRLEPAGAAGLFRAYFALLAAAAAKADELTAGLEGAAEAEPPTAAAAVDDGAADGEELAALASFMARLNQGLPPRDGAAAEVEGDDPGATVGEPEAERPSADVTPVQAVDDEAQA